MAARRSKARAETKKHERSRPLNNYPEAELARMESQGYIPAVLAAHALRVVPMTVYGWLKKGRVQGIEVGAVQYGKRRYVLRTSLQTFVGSAAFTAAKLSRSVADLLRARTAAHPLHA